MLRLYLCIIVLLGRGLLSVSAPDEPSSSKRRKVAPVVVKEVLKWTLRPVVGARARNIYARNIGQRSHRGLAPLSDEAFPDVSECILLFGAYCNGNLGDVLQPAAMEDILSSVAPNQCFCDIVQKSAVLLEKALFISGRDKNSVSSFSYILGSRNNTVVQPEEVVLVTDPILSDSKFSDTDGKCWRQSEGDYQQPLCFVLPASNTPNTTAMHRQLVEEVVRPGDVFVNIFPKHQKEIEEHGYPGEVEQILDPNEYTERLCSCRAIISSRLHGNILGLHMGVPTFGAFNTDSLYKVPSLILDIMGLPEQFFLIDEHLTREVVDVGVEAVREMYVHGDRRAEIYARLSEIHEDFKSHAEHVLFDIIGVKQQALNSTEPDNAGTPTVHGAVKPLD